MKALTPTEHKSQLVTFVDLFVREFKAEVWYLEESARGNIPGREEASLTSLFNVMCGLASILQVPAVALGFIASVKLYKAVISAAADAGSGVGSVRGDSGYSVESDVPEDLPDIKDAGVVESTHGGPSVDGIVVGSALIDIEGVAVLSRWLGYQLALRYEHLLVERVSVQPEAALIGLARHAARGSFAYMVQNGGFVGSADERLDKLLMGVMTGRQLNYHRPLTAFARKERIFGRGSFGKELLYAEHAFVNGVWVNETANSYKHPGTEWVRKGKPDQKAKYGFAIGLIASPELSLLSTDDGQLREWLERRHCRPVSVSDIRAYCQHEMVTAARECGVTADLSFHRFLASLHVGFNEQGRAVFQGDLSEMDLRSCDFSGVNFSGATIAGDLSHCCFDQALLYGVIGVGLKSDADSRVSFVDAELGFSTLAEADFKGLVDVTQANLSCCNLTNTKFGRLAYEGAVWHKAVLTGVAYEGLAEEQRAQIAALEGKHAQQTTEFKALNDKVAALVAQVKPLLGSLATDALPAAGAGGPASPASEADSRQREQLEALLQAQEKRLQFEAYCQSKLAQLSSVADRNVGQITLLEGNLARVHEARAKGDAALQSQIDAWVERVGVDDSDAQLSELRGLVDELGKMSLPSDMAAEARESYLEKRAAGKVLDVYMTQLSQREQDLHFYVQPDVVERVPDNKAPGEYMFTLEKEDSLDSTMSLVDEMNAYLESPDKVMLLLGEPGVGKSLFAWYSAQPHLATCKQVLQGIEPTKTPWLPVVIELKHYRLSQLEDLLPTILKQTCRLLEDELKALQNDNKPAHRLLVVLDGFDELKQEADGGASLKTAFKDIYTTCGANGWHAGQTKLIVTCRTQELPDRYLEEQYFGFGEGKVYRRRILLPFSQNKIGEYLAERTREATSSDFELLPFADYQKVLLASAAVREMVRNPFVLRLFVEALPGIRKSGFRIDQIKRYDIYQGSVQQWLEREVLKLDAHWQHELAVDRLGVEAVAGRFEQFACTLANEMYRHNSLVVDLNEVDRADSAFEVWAGFETQLFIRISQQTKEVLSARYQAMGAFELGELADEGVASEAEYVADKGKYFLEEKEYQRAQNKSELAAFLRTSLLRHVGRSYSFSHKSFYDYFIARGVIQIASCDKPVEARLNETLAYLSAVKGHESSRLWQEPEVLDLVCEYWLKAAAEEKQRMKETWFSVIEATKGHPEHGVAGANAGTLLNWVGVSFTYKNWQGIHMPGVDLRRAYLEGSDLRGADLSCAWLGKIQANKVDLRGANLTAIEFGERPAVRLEDNCHGMAYHPYQPIVAMAEGEVVRQYHFGESRWIGAALEGHTDNVTSLCYSRDGRWLASGSNDKTIRQWDAESGRPRGKVIVGHTGEVTSVDYSKDGRWLASGSYDKTVRQWEAETGEPRGEALVGPTGVVFSISYSGNGHWLAGGGEDRTIRQWDAGSGEPRGVVLRDQVDWVTCIRYSPDGRWLAAGSIDKTIRQWDAESGKPRGEALVGHAEGVKCICYSGDGRWLASGSEDRTVRQWDVESGEPRGRALVGHTSAVTNISYSGDGRWLASGSYDLTIRQWQAEDSEPRNEVMRGHTRFVTSLSCSPDGHWLASGSGDNTIRQWDMETGESRGEALVGHTSWVNCVGYSGDGFWLASGGRDKRVRQWEAESGKPRGEALRAHAKGVTSISYSPDGRWLASASEDKAIRQWNTRSGKRRGNALRGHTDSVSSISYSRDGHWLASGSWDRTVRQWDAKTGKPRGEALVGHTHHVVSVRYSPDGRWLASGSNDKTIRQWEAESGEPRGKALAGHTHNVTSISYSGDGRWLASGSYDMTIRQWDARSGESRGEVLVGHTGAVDSICYSGDGCRLASGGWDGTVRVWRREAEVNVGCAEEAFEVWRLNWGSKSNLMQLCAKGIKLAGAIGLEPHQMELLRQHGYEGDYGLECADYSRDDGLAAAVEESKAEPADTETESGSDAGQQLARDGLFAESPRRASATSGGVEEAKEPDSNSGLARAHSGK